MSDPMQADDKALNEWTRQQGTLFFQAKLTPDAQSFLERLPPKMAKEFGGVFTNPAVKARGSPRQWKPNGTQMKTRALLDAVLVAVEAGLEPSQVLDLASAPVLRAINQKVESGTWSPMNAVRVLKAIRTTHYLVYNTCPRLLTRTIAHHEKGPKRDKMANVVEPSRYLDAALAAEQKAKELIKAGRAARGAVRVRDACLLALGTEVAWRRGENQSAHVEQVSFKTNAATVKVVQTKTGTERIVVITDSEVIRLLREHIGVRWSHLVGQFGG